MMASRLSNASGRSSLAINSGHSPGDWQAIRCLTFCKSSARRTKEIATKSTPSDNPNSKSWASFSVNAGISRITPGKLIPLLEVNIPPVFTSAITCFSCTERTDSANRPSSSRMRLPGFTESNNCGKSTGISAWLLVVSGCLAPSG